MMALLAVFNCERLTCLPAHAKNKYRTCLSLMPLKKLILCNSVSNTDPLPNRSIGDIFTVPLAISLVLKVFLMSSAYAYDCMTNSSGNFVCIHSVYAVPGTSLKRLVTSLNGGRPVSYTINCANPDWDATSINDRACSIYR